MSTTRDDLRSYYEAEARLRRRGPLRGRRIELGTEFIALLKREQRRSVIDFGAGPGRDGQAFAAAGFRFVGIDLAHGNGRLAAEDGLSVVQGSIAAPPIRPESFDAGWSMSTLMHVPAVEVPDTLGAMLVPLRRDAPLLVGLWGGDEQDIVSDDGIEGERRLFSLRTLEQNRRLLATHATVEDAMSWEVDGVDWYYQVFRLRRA